MADSKTKYAMAFFDGQNLYRHAKDAFGHHHPNYDPLKLHAAICELRGWTPNLVRFYTGVPSREKSEMWAGYWEQRKLQMTRAGIHVTTRNIRYRKVRDTGPDDESREYEAAQEKGIDVRIALDIVSCARKQEYDVAVIYSQDQDLNEVVQEVKAIAEEQGREIELACAFPSGERATFKRGIEGTDWIRLEKEFYDKCLDDTDYRPRKFRR